MGSTNWLFHGFLPNLVGYVMLVPGGVKKKATDTDNLANPGYKHFRYRKWRNPHLYKLYGYGLCKGVSLTPHKAGYKVLSYL